MITLATNIAWGTSPTNYFDLSYESKREGGIQFYRLQISCNPLSGTAYFGYPIYLEIALDGAVLDTYTLKTASKRQWSEALTYTTDWLSVSRTSGTTALVVRIYSGSGSTRNTRYSYALPLDAVASTITATDAYIGSTSTIIISRASALLRHTIAYRMDGDGEYTEIASLTDQNTIGWTVPVSTYGKISDNSAIGVTIRCDTYDGAELLGFTTCRMTARCDPALCAPTVSLSAEDVRPETLALTGDAAKIIAGAATLRARVSAEAREGANLSTIYYDFGDSRVTYPAVMNSIERSLVTTATVLVRVTDSRGLSTEIAAAGLTLIPYVRPYVHIAASRPTSTASEAVVKISGQCWQGSFGAVENTLALRVRAREQSGNCTEWVTLTLAIEGNRFTAEEMLTGLDYNKVYTIEAEVEDSLFTASGTTQLMSGVPLFHWGKDHFTHRTPLRLIKGAELLAGDPIDILRSDGTLQARIFTASGVQVASYDSGGDPVAFVTLGDGGVSVLGEQINLIGKVALTGDLTVTGSINGE